MARLDPTQATAKWASNLSNATQAITTGVQGVTTAPGAAAAAQVNLWLQRIQQSAQKWQKNVGAVSLADWQKSMIDVGIPRIATGVQAKQGKYMSFAEKFYPYLAQGVAKVKAMPKGGLAESIARSTAMIQHNYNYKTRG